MTVIDVHAHFVPLGLPDLADRYGDPAWPVMHTTGDDGEIVQHGRRYRAVDLSYWDIDHRLETLDALGIDVQVLSPLPVMLPFWADGARVQDYCAAYNELLAEACARHPGRFLALGIVPVQDPELAAKELRRVKDLGLAGVELGTWLGDARELADDGIGEIFQALAESDLAALLHPNHPAPFGQPVPFATEFGVGVPCETARCMAGLHLAGTIERCDGLRLCLSHGGGAFLWLWPRFRGIAGRSGASTELPSVYVDTAGLDATNLAYLAHHVAEDRVLLGTDLPAAGEAAIRANFAALAASGDDAVARAGTAAERFLSRAA